MNNQYMQLLRLNDSKLLLKLAYTIDILYNVLDNIKDFNRNRMSKSMKKVRDERNMEANKRLKCY